MAKFYGKVGYGIMTDTGNGVYEPVPTEVTYKGDVLKNSRKYESADGVNDGIKLNQLISIVADPFALHNYFAITYVKWMGACWKVTNVEVQSPRLILTLGGVYNGPTVKTT